MTRMLRNITLMAMTSIAVLCAVSSCNDTCMGNSNGIPLAAFYNDGKTVTIDSLTVYGIGAPNDSAIIKKSTASQVYLPLRITVTNCQYVFDYNTELNDTLSLDYEIIPYFESKECGAMYNFNIKTWDYTRHAIDSVAIPDTKITNNDVVTIKIYMQ